MIGRPTSKEGRPVAENQTVVAMSAEEVARILGGEQARPDGEWDPLWCLLNPTLC